MRRQQQNFQKPSLFPDLSSLLCKRPLWETEEPERPSGLCFDRGNGELVGPFYLFFFLPQKKEPKKGGRKAIAPLLYG